MLFYPSESIAIFIDGPNLYSAAKGLGFEIDYKKLLELFANRGNLLRAYYYTTIAAADDEFTPLRPLIDWLGYNGYHMVTKPMRKFVDSQGRERSKGSMEVEIATDMLTLASAVDHLILFSGDGDFRYALEAVQRLGKRVSVVSTIKTSPSLISDDLRRQADNFIELDTLKESFSRTVQQKTRILATDD